MIASEGLASRQEPRSGSFLAPEQRIITAYQPGIIELAPVEVGLHERSVSAKMTESCRKQVVVDRSGSSFAKVLQVPRHSGRGLGPREDHDLRFGQRSMQPTRHFRGYHGRRDAVVEYTRKVFFAGNGMVRGANGVPGRLGIEAPGIGHEKRPADQGPVDQAMVRDEGIYLLLKPARRSFVRTDMDDRRQWALQTACLMYSERVQLFL